MSPTALIAKGHFSGTGIGFFKIYIVNLCLLLITLGLYYPWAKTRMRRYLYGNLSFGPYHFDYHADPKKIFKIFIIFYAALGILGLLFILEPVTLNFLILPWIIASFFGTPLLILHSLKFNAAMTSFANIRFRFNGTYGGLFAVLYLWPLLSSISFGLAIPFAIKKYKEYLINHHSWGQMPLTSQLTTAPFYLITACCLIIPFYVIVTATSYNISDVMHAEMTLADFFHQDDFLYALTLLALVMIPFSYLFFISYIRLSLLQNLNISFQQTNVETSHDRNRQFQSFKLASYPDAPTGRFLFFHNQQIPILLPLKTSIRLMGYIVITLLTLGLYYPFALINIARYISTQFSFSGNLDLMKQNKSPKTPHPSPTGNEIGNSLSQDLAI